MSAPCKLTQLVTLCTKSTWADVIGTVTTYRMCKGNATAVCPMSAHFSAICRLSRRSFSSNGRTINCIAGAHESVNKRPWTCFIRAQDSFPYKSQAQAKAQ